MVDWLTWDGGALTADVVTSYDHEAAVKMTEHPVETGAVITDHRISEPKRLTVEFAQSRQPLRMKDLAWKQQEIDFIESRFQPSGLLLLSTAVEAGLKAAGQALGLLSGGSKLKVYSLTAKDPDSNRIQDLHDQLLDLLDGGTECTFTFQGLVLSGFYVTSVKRSTKAGEGGLSRFVLDLQHVQTVQTAAAALAGGFELPGILSAIPLLDLGKKSSRQEIEDNQYKRALGAGDLDLNVLGGAI